MLSPLLPSIHHLHFLIPPKRTAYRRTAYRFWGTSDFRSKILSLEKVQIKFGFLLTYLYLCNAI